VHPDREGALKYLDLPTGKTEAWYIIDSRTIDGVQPYVYAGFKPGVTRERWRDLFDRQDIEGMCDSMHRVPVSTGDVILIPAGMPHAMGSGCLFLEIHEACDYTFRLEKRYLGTTMTDDQIHYGIGLDAMFDLFHYDTYSDEEIRNRIRMLKIPVKNGSGGTRSHIVTYDATDRFAVDTMALTGTYELPEFDGHAIVITSEGETAFSFDGGSFKAPQGRGIFVPAAAGPVTVDGAGEVVVAYPYQP